MPAAGTPAAAAAGQAPCGGPPACPAAEDSDPDDYGSGYSTLERQRGFLGAVNVGYGGDPADTFDRLLEEALDLGSSAPWVYQKLLWEGDFAAWDVAAAMDWLTAHSNSGRLDALRAAWSGGLQRGGLGSGSGGGGDADMDGSGQKGSGQGSTHSSSGSIVDMDQAEAQAGNGGSKRAADPAAGPAARRARLSPAPVQRQQRQQQQQQQQQRRGRRQHQQQRRQQQRRRQRRPPQLHRRQQRRPEVGRLDRRAPSHHPKPASPPPVRPAAAVGGQ